MFVEITLINDKKMTINVMSISHFKEHISSFSVGTMIYMSNHKEIIVKEPYGYLQEKIIKYQRII